ncbi:hypothetical protein LIER_27659 [Lithospermum erythrorhizon]|uniref:Uncharacterized protein n=1 Tax=Lithospermum erythrorhizon TaxID=34254 RepID=A0AAV3RE09_LITER
MVTQEFFVSDDVKFVETVFPFASVDRKSSVSSPLVVTTLYDEFDQDKEHVEVPTSPTPSADPGVVVAPALLQHDRAPPVRLAQSVMAWMVLRLMLIDCPLHQCQILSWVEV